MGDYPGRAATAAESVIGCASTFVKSREISEECSSGCRINIRTVNCAPFDASALYKRSVSRRPQNTPHPRTYLHIATRLEPIPRSTMPEETAQPGGRRILVIAQQDLQGHHRRTEHWALIVLDPDSPTSRAADVFQLAGNMDTFHFEAIRVPDVLKMAELCGGCRLGDVAEDAVDNLRRWLEQRPVVHYDRLWDCQDWLLEAVWALKEESGWVTVDEGITERKLRDALTEERELWEKADDHYFERMFG